MKKRYTVIFCFIKKEVEFAIQYKNSHSKEVTLIIAGSLETHVHLLKKGISPFTAHEILYSQKQSYYKTYVKRYYLDSTKVFELFKKHLSDLEFLHVNLVEVMQLLLEPEFVDVLHAYDVFTKIEKDLTPDQYLFPRYLKTGLCGWDTTFLTSAALIADFFCPKEKKRYYDTYNSNFFSLSFPKLLTQFFRSPYKLFRYLYVLFARSKDAIFLRPTHKTTDILLFSAGSNLYYYHNLFALWENQKQPPKYEIVTGSQSIEDEYKLRMANISFIPLETYKKKEMDDQIIQKVKVYEKQVASLSLTKFRDISSKEISHECKDAYIFKAKLVLEKYGKKFIRQIALTSEVFTLITTKLTITTHDPSPTALPFVFMSRRKNIKTLVLLHGLHAFNFGSDHKSDYVASWGPWFTIGYSKYLHRKTNTVFPVGFPYLDELFQKYILKRKQKKQPSDLFHHPIRLGFLLTLYQNDQFATCKFLIDIFALIQKNQLPIEIWIRTHAGQKIEKVKELAKYYSIPCRYNESITLDEFVTEADILYACDTTAILWPMLYQKPLFYSTPWWGGGDIPVGNYKAAWIPSSAMDFVKELQKLIVDPQRAQIIFPGQKRFLTKILGVTDGTSTTKLSGIIHSLSQQ